MVCATMKENKASHTSLIKDDHCFQIFPDIFPPVGTRGLTLNGETPLSKVLPLWLALPEVVLIDETSPVA